MKQQQQQQVAQQVACKITRSENSGLVRSNSSRSSRSSSNRTASSSSLMSPASATTRPRRRRLSCIHIMLLLAVVLLMTLNAGVMKIYNIMQYYSEFAEENNNAGGDGFEILVDSDYEDDEDDEEDDDEMEQSSLSSSSSRMKLMMQKDKRIVLPKQKISASMVALPLDFDKTTIDSTCYPVENRTLLDTIQAPHFILAGAQKAGTSALFHILRKHPNLNPSRRFEVHFFDRLPSVKHAKPVHRLTAKQICAYRRRYLQEFDLKTLVKNQRRKLITNQTARQLLSFEKSPVYLSLLSVPGHIRKITPWTKVIIALRNPVDRAYSEYKMYKDRQSKRARISFEQKLDTEIALLRKYNLTNAPYCQTMYHWWAGNISQINNNEHNNNMSTMEDAMDFWWKRHEKDRQQVIGNNNTINNETNSTIEEAMATDPGGKFHFHLTQTSMLKRTRRMLGRPKTMRPKARYLLQTGILARGMYAQQISHWMKHGNFKIGKNLLVIHYERFEQDRQMVLSEIYDFLGVKNVELGDAILEKSYSPVKNRTYDIPMSNITRQYLQDFYTPYNEELADLLGEEWRNVWQYNHDD